MLTIRVKLTLQTLLNTSTSRQDEPFQSQTEINIRFRLLKITWTGDARRGAVTCSYLEMGNVSFRIPVIQKMLIWLPGHQFNLPEVKVINEVNVIPRSIQGQGNWKSKYLKLR